MLVQVFSIWLVNMVVAVFLRKEQITAIMVLSFLLVIPLDNSTGMYPHELYFIWSLSAILKLVSIAKL